MSFRFFFSKCFHDSFLHCCHCLCLLILVIVFFFPDVTNDQLLSVNAKLSVGESLSSLRKHFPWFHGLTDSMTGGASLRRLSDGYFYINLPPIFMCLLSGCVEKSVRKKNKQKKRTKRAILLWLVAFLSDQEHMTTKSESYSEPWRAIALLYLHAAVREKYCLCVSIPKWLTAHSCVCTLL